MESWNLEMPSVKYHIVTPFSRPENFNRLRDMLKPFDVDWHLLIDDPPTFELHYDETWIHKYLIPKTDPPWKMWRRCIQCFVEAPGIFDDDRYLILADDCFYEPDFFAKIDKHPGELVICSMKRGDNTPAGASPERAHGTDTLVAAPENMHPCGVSAEQIILSGKLFRRINLIVATASDGYMIEAMVNDHVAEYAPEAFVWFNYLEPGRWNK
jgi:hypothetical protein